MRLCNSIFRVEVLLGLSFAAAFATGTFAEGLSPDTIAKAKAFKEADVSYVHALCDGSRSNRDTTRTARKQVEDELEKLIDDIVARAPDVQKSLDAAADAGEAASKTAADPNATSTDKAAAQEKFQKAKDVLRVAVANQRSLLETQISHDFNVKFEAATDCPEQPKTTSRQRSVPARAAHRSAPQTGAQGAPVEAYPRAGIGGVGGVAIGVGGFGIVIGR
jgi:hypothetical protein